MIVYLYGLRARGGPIRYIGKADDFQRRFFEHKKRARRGMKLPIYDWWRSMAEDPEIIPLVLVDHDHWQDAERSLIAAMRDYGARLLNVATGGEGGDFMQLKGQPLSREHRRRISIGMKNSPKRFRPHLSRLNLERNTTEKGKAIWTEERRKALSAKMRGSGNPFYGRKHSISTRNRIASAMRERHAHG